MASVRFENVSISYGAKQVVKDFSLSVNNGEIMGIIGPSGCGKTTLIRALCGLIKPDKGNIYINDQLVFSDEKRINVAPERRGIGVVFQDYAVWPHLSVWDNVCYPMKKHKVPKEEIAKRAAYALEQVRMTGYEKHMPAQLSGGQQQRVAIARALATKPKILLCDEATSALDPQSTQSILGLIRDIHDRLCITVIVITHQMSVVEQICTRVAILDGGEVAEEGKVSEVFAAPQSQAAKRLVYPEGYEQPVVKFDEGRMLRVVFNGAKATKTPLIAQMALDCGITASILGASTKGIGEKAYGNMLLGIPGGDAELQRAMDYLRSIPDIFVEEVDGHV